MTSFTYKILCKAWRRCADGLADRHMSLPSGTSQADAVRLRKTCRRCRQPLYDNGTNEHFPVAGIGVMHLECARAYCSESGITLEEAVPICKHWRLKGHCIYQVNFNSFHCTARIGFWTSEHVS